MVAAEVVSARRLQLAPEATNIGGNRTFKLAAAVEARNVHLNEVYKMPAQSVGDKATCWRALGQSSARTLKRSRT